jgi:hypothetical protein
MICLRKNGKPRELQSVLRLEIHADFGERFKPEAPKGAFIHKTGGRAPSARQRARQMIPDFLFGSTACG